MKFYNTDVYAKFCKSNLQPVYTYDSIQEAFLLLDF